MIGNLILLVALAILVAASLLTPSKVVIAVILLACAGVLVWMAKRLARDSTLEEKDATWSASKDGELR